MNLRGYQSRAVGDVLSRLDPTCLVSATGSGKTVMGVALIQALVGAAVLWLVHRRELLIQADSILQAFGLRDRVTPYTVQTLLASGHRPSCDVIILDEAHHYAADEWGSVRQHYAAARCIGLTATPERSDGRPLGDIFTRLVVAADYSELLRDGHLVPCRVVRPDRGLTRGLAQDPVAAYLAHGNGGSGFVFAPRVEEAETLAQRFTDAGVPSLVVSERSSQRARDHAITALKRGYVRLLTNVYTLTEGVDVPAASVCLLARGVGHIAPYLQMAGRVLRPAPAKTEAILIDLPGVSHEFGFPTDDRVYSLEGQGIRSKVQSITVCLKCGTSYEAGPKACPEYGFVKPFDEWQPLKIYNAELRAVYAGAATPTDARRREYQRLRALARGKGWSIEWVVKQYRMLFGVVPDLSDVTQDERAAELERWRRFGAERGFKPRFAEARYHSVFHSWPTRGRRAA